MIIRPEYRRFEKPSLTLTLTPEKLEGPSFKKIRAPLWFSVSDWKKNSLYNYSTRIIFSKDFSFEILSDTSTILND
ncbi:hypothetical protein HNY73_000235 [Argiope bruennichi]|uniref:Uncharacterized protein n=1 Tax=Argiope bruennichi TaxID=94029 RepID=A0A8T0G3E0_ARGBR|nr:hypothetical protein HNY73_000235 [Argiope bruennichi]